MERILIEGGIPLQGEISVQGAKNSILPILAATLLNRGESVLCSAPHLRDVDASAAILRHLGCKVHREGGMLTVDTAGLCRCEISDALMREMRSSAIFLGAILARCGQAVLSYPGGCELGARPIDLHLKGLRRLGADIREEGTRLYCRAEKLTGCDVPLSLPSVGATENLMLAAVGAEGVTRILGAAREPEIVDLQAYLRACGADVAGAGTETVTVRGGMPLHDVVFTVMPDRIAAATYLCAAAGAGGEICLTNAQEAHLSAVTDALRRAGCEIHADARRVRLRRTRPLQAAGSVVTAPYPGFPTDAQAVVMAALLRGTGVTEFTENIFENRYRHVEELRRLGAEITVEGCQARVTGVPCLHAARVCASDLRGGAALCVAALTAEGKSVVTGLRHIDRGYEDLAASLRALGARAVRETEPE